MLAGLATAGVMGWLTVQGIGLAWLACDDLEPGGSWALLFGFFPGVTLAAWVAFAVGSFVLKRRRPLVRFLAGFVLASLVCLAAFAQFVPAYGEATYRSSVNADNPECGPHGIPRWWPTWLAS